MIYYLGKKAGPEGGGGGGEGGMKMPKGTYLATSNHQISTILFHSLFIFLSAPEESSMNCTDLNYSSLYAFVKFYSARAARRAKESISGTRLLGGQFLKVSSTGCNLVSSAGLLL